MPCPALTLLSHSRVQAASGVEAKRPPEQQVTPLITPALSSELDQMMCVPGMDTLMRFVSSGQFAGRLPVAELGSTLPETASPETHLMLLEICRALGIDICPEIIERSSSLLAVEGAGGEEGAATAAVAAAAAASPLLMQLPLSLSPLPEATSGSGSGSGSRARPPSARPGTPATAGSSSTSSGSLLGWRRRALLLLPPGRLEDLPPLEAQAAMAMALAPMALPGGGGWALSLGQSSAWSSPSGGGKPSTMPGISPSMTAGEAAEARMGASSSPSLGPSAASQRPVGGAWPAVADVATAAALGLVLPAAFVGQLPPELQVWVGSHSNPGHRPSKYPMRNFPRPSPLWASCKYTPYSCKP